MCDCEPPDCAEWRSVRARKQHRCCECPAPIEPGEIHSVISGIWDGCPGRFRTCAPCLEVRDQLERDIGRDCCVPLGGLWEHLGEACRW